MKQSFAFSLAAAPFFMAAFISVAAAQNGGILQMQPAPDASGAVETQPAKPGLEALPLENKVVVFNNVNPVFDNGRMVFLTAQTPTAPGAAVNYYRSILLSDGWKPVGVASSIGMVMEKDGQRLQMMTRYNDSHEKGGATILTFALTDAQP